MLEHLGQFPLPLLLILGSVIILAVFATVDIIICMPHRTLLQESEMQIGDGIIKDGVETEHRWGYLSNGTPTLRIYEKKTGKFIVRTDLTEEEIRDMYIFSIKCLND